jgi:hypothetical protein
VVRPRRIAGADRKYAAAEARYGWAGYPDCNLYHAERLPASPFRYE